MPRPPMPEDELLDEHIEKQEYNSEQLVNLLKRLHPEHDVPGIDDVAAEKPKKRVWPEELR